jgi:DNA-binding CsgD family transcriptional regulator
VVTNDLLHEMLSELAAPMLLIGNDKRLHFASPAFRRLAAMDIEGMPCDVLLHPANSARVAGHCCWHVLDVYLASGEPGLWQLRNGQNALRPILCEMRAIEVAGRPVMIAILVKPLSEPISPIALSFFRCLRRSAASVELYEENVATYLKKHYGFGVAMWSGCSRDDMPTEHSLLTEKLIHVIDGIGAVDPLVLRSDLFDVVVELDGRERVFHVFQSHHGVRQRRLVLGDTGGKLGDEAIGALRAAVAVRAEPADLPVPGNRVINPSLIELLSVTERKILGCLQQGMSDKEIACLRRVSVNTVRNQVRAVMRKLGVSKRTHLVAFNLAEIQEEADIRLPAEVSD